MSQTVELATAYLSLVPSLQGAQGKIAEELTGEGEKAGKGFGASFKSALLPVMGAVVGAIGIGKIVDGVKAAINTASDLNEAGTAINAVFGGAADGIQEWASSAATGLGQSKLAALNAAQTFGVYGQAAGLADTANLDFSTNLTHLASGLASFYNTSPEEAVEALGAGLRGEAEPLRKYGILLDDATLKQKALELGIYEGSGSLTQQQRVLAANAAIMEQGALAYDDFANTSDGLANQQRISAALWENVSGKIGQLFLPGVLAATSVLNETFLPMLSKVVDWVTDTLVPVFGAISATIGDALGPLIGQIAEVWSQFSPLSILFQALQPVLPVLAAALGQIAGTLGGALGQALSAVSSALSPVVELLVGQLSTVLVTLVPIVAQVATTLGSVLGQVLTALSPLLALVADLVGQVLMAVLPLIDPILGLVAAFLPLLTPIIQLVGALLEPLIKLLTALLTPILALISPLVDLLAGALGVVVDVIATVIGWIVQGITWFVALVTGSEEAGAQLNAVWTAVGRWFSDVWNGIVSGLRNAINWIGSLVGGIWNTVMGALGNVGSWLVNAGGDLIRGFWNGIANMGQWLWNQISSFFDGVVGWAKDILGIHSPSKVFADEVGAQIGAGIAEGIGDTSSLIDDTLSSVLTVPDVSSLAPSVGTASYSGTLSASDETHLSDGPEILAPIEINTNDPDLAGMVVADRLRRR